MQLGLTGKVALVTGASGGIGAAIAQRLAQEGCRVALIARNLANLEAVRSTLTGPHGAEAMLCVCDVTDAAQIDSTVSAVVEAWESIDVLVNNAGGLTTTDLQPFEQLSDEDFVRTWNFNFLSAVRFTRRALPHMIRNRWGRVINISSESAAQPDARGADYNASKAALNTFTKTISKAYGSQGILANVVAPAFTLTPLVREFIESQARATGSTAEEAERALLNTFRPNIVLGRAGRAEETAAVVAFLASDLASFVTGSVIRADGGSIASV